MHVVNTARLVLGQRDAVETFAVGEAIPAELTIAPTCNWARDSATNLRSLTFCYELDASPDTWVIGGQRRTAFTASDGEEKAFTILLLPQRPGHLMYPSIDIRLMKSANVESEQPSQETAFEPDIHCEVDYKSQGMSVLVVPAIASTTVGVNFGQEPRTWVMDAERDPEYDSMI